MATYFRGQLRLISAPPQGGVALHRELLYVALIDAVARLRYPKLKNKDRFLAVLRDHSGWAAVNHVSLPVLLVRTTNHPDPKVSDSELRTFLSTTLPEWEVSRRRPRTGPWRRWKDREGVPDSDVATALPAYSNPTPIGSFDNDGSTAKVREVATEKEKNLVEDSRHAELLYDYRNFLVHEFRKPGGAMEVFAGSGDEPCYHRYINASGWRLVYPVGLFARLAGAIVSSLETYWLSKGIDPYQSLRTTLDWWTPLKAPMAAKAQT